MNVTLFEYGCSHFALLARIVISFIGSSVLFEYNSLTVVLCV